MQTEQDTDRVVVTYHLLRPLESELKIAPLDAKKVGTSHEQGVWRTAKLVSRCTDASTKASGNM